MADKTSVDRLDNLVNELLQRNTNAAPDMVGLQPTDALPLGSSDLVDMTMESPQEDKVASADLIHTDVARKININDLTTKSDSPAVGKKVESDVEEVDPDHGSVKRKLNFTDLTKSDLPAVGKKENADSDVEELNADHEKVRKMVRNILARPAVCEISIALKGPGLSLPREVRINRQGESPVSRIQKP